MAGMDDRPAVEWFAHNAVVLRALAAQVGCPLFLASTAFVCCLVWASTARRVPILTTPASRADPRPKAPPRPLPG